MTKRTERLNSLLKEVIAEVITKDVRNPDVHSLVTVTSVDITRDLKYAKVYISVIANDAEKELTLKALQSAAGFIGVNSAKKVVLRYFPQLTFKLDETVQKQMRIQEVLQELKVSELPDEDSYGIDESSYIHSKDSVDESQSDSADTEVGHGDHSSSY